MFPRRNSELGLSQPLSRQRPLPQNRGGGARGRLEKKLSALPSLWISQKPLIFDISYDTFFPFVFL
jgi:hypothetical protein